MMKRSLKPFFKDIFLNTKGFVPVFPFQVTLEIGDYFMVERGQIIKLGGIRGNEDFFDLEEPVKISDKFVQPSEIWQTENRIKTSYKSRGAALEWDNIYLSEIQQALIVEFLEKGSYYFRCSEVSARRFENFAKLSEQILQKFVSKEFNFKEIYVVTELASSDRYAVSVAESHGNLAIEFGEEGYYDLNDLVSTDVVCYPQQSKNLSYNSLDSGKCEFFRAARLDISYDGKQHVSEHIRHHLPENMQEYYHNMMNYAKTRMLKLTNVFPGNAVDFYSFYPMGLEDIEDMFQ
ncbi:MAG: hypothetical protein WBA74_12615 [Cyclobacteriaceae bacterium]